MELSKTYSYESKIYDITYMKFFDEGDDYDDNMEKSYLNSICDIDYTSHINSKPITYSKIYKIKRFFIIIFQFIFRN